MSDDDISKKLKIYFIIGLYDEMSNTVHIREYTKYEYTLKLHEEIDPEDGSIISIQSIGMKYIPIKALWDYLIIPFLYESYDDLSCVDKSFYYIRDKNYEGLQKLIDQNSENVLHVYNHYGVDYPEYLIDRILLNAIQWSDVNLVIKLLHHGATLMPIFIEDVKKSNIQKCFETALQTSSIDMHILFLQKGAEIDISAIQIATVAGDLNVLKLFYKHITTTKASSTSSTSISTSLFFKTIQDEIRDFPYPSIGISFLEYNILNWIEEVTGSLTSPSIIIRGKYYLEQTLYQYFLNKKEILFK